MDDVETETVDPYSTLVDVDPQAAVLVDRTPDLDDDDEAASVSATWRTQHLVYSTLANDVDAYRPFRELIDLGLAYALAAHGHGVDAATRESLGPEPDAVVESLTAVADRLA